LTVLTDSELSELRFYVIRMRQKLTKINRRRLMQNYGLHVVGFFSRSKLRKIGRPYEIFCSHRLLPTSTSVFGSHLLN